MKHQNHKSSPSMKMFVHFVVLYGSYEKIEASLRCRTKGMNEIGMMMDSVLRREISAKSTLSNMEFG
jgi:hypothetical protein